jgi:hypothetical protein
MLPEPVALVGSPELGCARDDLAAAPEFGDGDDMFTTSL